jgi:hypothetical protein
MIVVALFTLSYKMLLLGIEINGASPVVGRPCRTRGRPDFQTIILIRADILKAAARLLQAGKTSGLQNKPLAPSYAAS